MELHKLFFEIFLEEFLMEKKYNQMKTQKKLEKRNKHKEKTLKKKKQMRKQKKIIFQQPDHKEAYNYEEMVQHYLEETPNTMQIQLQRAFAGLGKKCKEVLSLFYYRGYSIEEICLAMNYENKNVVKR